MYSNLATDNHPVTYYTVPFLRRMQDTSNGVLASGWLRKPKPKPITVQGPTLPGFAEISYLVRFEVVKQENFTGELQKIMFLSLQRKSLEKPFEYCPGSTVI